MSRIPVKQFLPDTFAVVTDGAAVTLDCNNQSIKNNFLNSAQTAITITLSNFVDGSRYTVEIKKQSASDLVFTFPGTVVNGPTFTLSGAANTFYKFVISAFTDSSLKYFVESSVSGASVNAAGSISGLKSEDQFYAQGITNGTYPIVTKKVYAETLTKIWGIKTSNGTLTVAFQINGTNITGLSALSISSVTQDVVASALNAMVAGDSLSIVVSSAAAPVDFQFIIEWTR